MKAYLTLYSQDNFTGLSVADVKAHLNVTDSAQDGYLSSLLDASVSHVERVLQLDLRRTVWRLVCEQFPLWANWNFFDRYGGELYVWPGIWEQAVGRTTQRWQEIPLVRGPVRSVDSVSYYDLNNASQTLASTTYAVAAPSYLPGRLEPVLTWPVAYPRPDAVTVQFTTGFTTVPASILHAIRLLVGQYWTVREASAYGPNTALSVSETAVDNLLSDFLVRSYG